MTTVHWTSGSTNRKTGDIPTAWIGKDLEDSRATCAAVGCLLLASGQCYAQFGSVALAMRSSVTKTVARRDGEGQSLFDAIKEAKRTSRFVRLSAIGDAGVLPLSEWEEIRETAQGAGLGVLAYTHAWRERPDLAVHALASVSGGEEADQALAAGFRPAAIIPAIPEGEAIPASVVTPEGARLLVCPAQKAAAKGAKFLCNDCGLCDAQRPLPGNRAGIAFVDHSPAIVGRRNGAKGNAARAAKKAAAAIE